MVHSSDQFNLSLPQKIASAGLAGCTADLATFPLDTVKVWLQVRGEGVATSSGKSAIKITNNLKEPSGTKSFAGSKKQIKNNILSFTNSQIQPKQFTRAGSGAAAVLGRPNPGLMGTIFQGVKANGFLSLYGGIAAGLQRQVAFCAVRIGLYDNVKAFYQNLLPGSPNGKQIGHRILAGTTTAFIAVALFQPTEVVKIRMQAQTSQSAARIYSSSLHAYRSLFKAGFREAWRGVETNAARLGVVNVCELVTYDVVKELILDYRLMKDNPACHFTSAFLSGFITTIVASPIDVVKTRYMNSKTGQYKGPIDCAKNMFVKKGLRAFYKGFVPAYLRLGSWNIVMFVSYEQYKRLFHQWNVQH